MSQEEVCNAAGHRASGEAVKGLEPSPPLVKAVPILTLFQQQHELESVPLHAATHLVNKQKPGSEQGQSVRIPLGSLCPHGNKGTLWS